MEQKLNEKYEEACAAVLEFVKRTAEKETANPDELQAMTRIAVTVFPSRL